MTNRQLALTLGTFITGILVFFSSCKKINEATEIGSDLIPPIDNINTFDTTILVEAYNDLFTYGGTDPLKEDSTLCHYAYEQFLGLITNDPIFGKTDAQMYFELKPTSFPFRFRNFGLPGTDSLLLDSVVLILNYLETYGDTSAVQTINAYEITSEFISDTSIYHVRDNPSVLATSTLLGSKMIIPHSLDDSVQAYQDTTSHQLRIRLNDAFGEFLLKGDTATASVNNYFKSDSLFKTKFKGFALKSEGGGNAVMGFSLQGTNTKLAIYYKYTHGLGPTDYDTTVAYWTLTPTFHNYGSANFISRDYSGTPVQAAQGGATADPFVYIQNTPGTFAVLKTPTLGLLNNRVVHRAELICEQVYDISDSTFRPPSFMYLDAYSPTLSKYRNIPYDVIYDPNAFTYNFGSFGVAPINALDGSGNVIKTWKFNLTRYVQHVVNDTEPVYDLRLLAPFVVPDQYVPPAQGAVPVQFPPPVTLSPSLVKGRVRLAGGTPGPQRMRLRIIYSKL